MEPREILQIEDPAVATIDHNRLEGEFEDEDDLDDNADFRHNNEEVAEVHPTEPSKGSFTLNDDEEGELNFDDENAGNEDTAIHSGARGSPLSLKRLRPEEGVNVNQPTSEGSPGMSNVISSSLLTNDKQALSVFALHEAHGLQTLSVASNLLVDALAFLEWKETPPRPAHRTRITAVRVCLPDETKNPDHIRIQRCNNSTHGR
jgi:hypothetical protein